MEKVKISDFAEVITGGTPSTTKKEYWENGNIPWLQSGVCQNCDVNECDTFINELGLKNSSAKLMPKDTVLIALTGSTTGKVAYLNFEACANQSVTGILPNKTFKQRYIYYYLLSMREKILFDSYGGAQKHISQGYVKYMEIPIKTIQEQEKIINNLNIITESIEIRKKQLEELDNLVKSLFVEMFGDPVLNDKNWNVDILKKLTTKIGSGSTPSGGNQSYKDEGISLIRSMNVHDGRFEYKDLAYIDDNQAKQLDGVTIKKNDVLFNITGASVTRTCVVPENVIPARVNQHVSIIRCNNDINPVFLNYLLMNESMKRKLTVLAKAGGGTREAITKSQIENFEIILPQISEQNKFVSIVQQIDKQKFEIQKSLEEMEELKESLMNTYFG